MNDIAPIWTTGSTAVIKNRYLARFAGPSTSGARTLPWCMSGQRRHRQNGLAWRATVISKVRGRFRRGTTRFPPFALLHLPPPVRNPPATARRDMTEALSICKLERFVGDQALQHRLALPKPSWSAPPVWASWAVGPSGLLQRSRLCRLGFRVTFVRSAGSVGWRDALYPSLPV